MHTTFYLVRHGRTLFNEKHLFQGWCDSPLTEQGIAYAKALHNGLKDIPFAFAASSTSERAMDTLHYIRPDLTPHYYKGLRELYFGDLEGDPSDLETKKEHDWIGYAYCNGEDRTQARIRFMETLKQIAVEGNVLVVSHGSVICRTIQYLDPTFQRGPSPDILIPNCSVTLLDLDDGTFHLRALPSTKYREHD
ncbi:histidine phosphatase family protein [Catenisphaera adipataccumulans]|jgi:broad specificity phosphatase PhoE|uniref:Putative phosphoglycerate mutase n=1 Tax=Catenisphaera adipataccumulans TaxID=700500 RepID=A0A7W8CXI4_9FIRM|nr:histidine phosphatase family protein [Catenisphaera adipataccumulans]MBB5183465.1 putative phosphoglycerate mutase [Catenisphaera adipataccumulans]